MKNEESRGPDPALLIVLLSVGVFLVTYALCYTEYQRNFLEAYSELRIAEEGTWTSHSGRGTYYYCGIHSRGLDPQLLDMQARTFGWTEIRCPLCPPNVNPDTPSRIKTDRKKDKP